jgi:SAM-dependent methyltransferase
LLVLIAAGASVLFLTRDSSKPSEFIKPFPQRETTIRNVTREAVHFWVRPSGSEQPFTEKVIGVGEIQRFRNQTGWEVRFEKAGRTVAHSLAQGTPYSFRYDENNLLQIYEGSHGREDAEDLAPFVGTPAAVVDRMLEMAQLDATDIVYDLGCGDGRILIAAAKKYGARGVGVDIDPRRIKECRENAKAAGVEKWVRFRLGDAMKENVSAATVVALYLLPESNALLRPNLDAQLRPGTYVVCHDFHIPGWESKEIEAVSIEDDRGVSHSIFLYRR